MDSVRKFAKSINENEKRVDILINNAGVMMCPMLQSEDGYEMYFSVNHLGHVLLTNLLLVRIKVSAPARIINVSALAHSFGKINDDINNDRNYSPFPVYAQSKLANVPFTNELARRLEGTDVTTNSHLGRHMEAQFISILLMCLRPLVLLQKTPFQGPQTTLHCVLDERLDNVSGKYFSDCVEKQPSKAALNVEDAIRR